MGHRFIKIHPQIHAENTALFKKSFIKIFNYLSRVNIAIVCVGGNIYHCKYHMHLPCSW